MLILSGAELLLSTLWAPKNLFRRETENGNQWDTQKFMIGDLDGDFDAPAYLFGSKLNQQVCGLLNPSRVEMEDWDGQTIAMCYAYNPELVRAMQSLSWTELCPGCWSNLNRTRYISEDDPDMDMCGGGGGVRLTDSTGHHKVCPTDRYSKGSSPILSASSACTLCTLSTLQDSCNAVSLHLLQSYGWTYGPPLT